MDIYLYSCYRCGGLISKEVIAHHEVRHTYDFNEDGWSCSMEEDLTAAKQNKHELMDILELEFWCEVCSNWVDECECEPLKSEELLEQQKAEGWYIAC